MTFSEPANRLQPRLADLTTFHVGGPVREFRQTDTEAEFVAAIRDADQRELSLLVLGGGSNLVVADGLFDGVVVRDGRSGHPPVRPAGPTPDDQTPNDQTPDDQTPNDQTPDHQTPNHQPSDHQPSDNKTEGGAPVADGAGVVLVTMVAGQDWDQFVAGTIKHGLAGVEALSGIPGTVGAAPVQNIGAYGQDVSQSIHSVRVYDRQTGDIMMFTTPELEFGYRASKLKASMRPGTKYYPTPRYVVLDVTFALPQSELSMPIGYAQLATRLGVAVGDRAPLGAVREAVLALRASKGMLAPVGEFADDHDRWSAGSFFTNPILPDAAAAALPTDAPRFQHGSQTKTSAAWLIEHAGYTKGYGVHGTESKATLSTKHTLALTNRGTATAQDVAELARNIRVGVRDKYGITLEPEPVTVGFTL